MQTQQPNTIAAVILKYLIHLLSVAAFYGATIYLVSHYALRKLLVNFSRIFYGPDNNFHAQIYSLLAIYAVFCYLANNFILDLYKRSTIGKLLISMLVDLLIVPLELYIMIRYNNKTATLPIGEISSLYNVYVITGLLIVKTLIFTWILNRKEKKVKSKR